MTVYVLESEGRRVPFLDRQLAIATYSAWLLEGRDCELLEITAKPLIVERSVRLWTA